MKSLFTKLHFIADFFVKSDFTIFFGTFLMNLLDHDVKTYAYIHIREPETKLCKVEFVYASSF